MRHLLQGSRLECGPATACPKRTGVLARRQPLIMASKPPMPKATSTIGRFAWQRLGADSKIAASQAGPQRTSMAEIDIVKHDQGGVNARILARENKADFRRVEAASLKVKTSFASAEGK